MAVTKPSHLSSKMWANTGSLETPDDVKIDSGWVAEVPKSQVENWVQNRQDKAIGHINERGLAEWDSSTDYIASKSYVQGSDGNVYVSVQNSGPSNIPQNPVTDLSGTYWKVAFAADEHSHTISEVQGLQTALDDLVSDISNKQDTLVSGTNIKTINGASVLGSGDLNLPTGEVNTASNIGAGVGVFSAKVSTDLQFKSVVAGSGISVTSTADSITIENTGGGGGTIPNASATVVGGLKVRLDGTTLYITNDGSDA